MNIEKFIDAFGDDVYALALIVTKNFDSAERVFTQIAQDCDTFPETAELYDIVKRLTGSAVKCRQTIMLKHCPK